MPVSRQRAMRSIWAGSMPMCACGSTLPWSVSVNGHASGSFQTMRPSVSTHSTTTLVSPPAVEGLLSERSSM